MQEEGSGRQVPEGSSHCLNNCSFFWSAATTNLCSKCYRKLKAKPPCFPSHLKPQQPVLEQLNAKNPSIPLPAVSVPSSSYTSNTLMVEATCIEYFYLCLITTPREIETQKQMHIISTWRWLFNDTKIYLKLFLIAKCKCITCSSFPGSRAPDVSCRNISVSE